MNFLKGLGSWFHHLFNPHCPECAQENQCISCDTLGKLLAEERYEKSRLIEQIIELTRPAVINEIEQKEIPKPLASHIPWKVRRAILEQEDRVKAKITAEQKLNEIKPLTVEELEKQLGIEENAPRITEEIA